ncbi:MAG: cysteine--tRNA ligase [Oceanococcaceae bacterium]
MQQTLYNSLSGRKEPLEPRVPGEVGLYVCGVTVYDDCHLGHARFLLVFDTVVRQLRAQGLKVRYVRNITDIDDKIIRRAAENNEPISSLTERFIARFHEDCAALGLLPADDEPRATAHITDIVAMVEQLVAKDLAYVGGNGDVYFAVQRFADYGKLSGKRLDELRVGARIAADEAKRDALDFVLWKKAKPGEPSWESPWGPGRPGWHIECSAMSTCCLGPEFDIHGGGMDLKFPHHENEIAQSEGAHGPGFARYWLHNGFVQVGEEKMSKSLGNFRTIRDLLARYDGEVIRYFILSTHYRSPLIYTEEAMNAARVSLRRLYAALARAPVDPDATAAADDEAVRQFAAAMADDFNTAEAYAVLHSLARAVNSAMDAGQPDEAMRAALTLRQLGARLGLLGQVPDTVLQGGAEEDVRWIAEKIEQRQQARARRDFAASDRIRDELAARGIVLRDGPNGTTWERQ